MGDQVQRRLQLSCPIHRTTPSVAFILHTNAHTSNRPTPHPRLPRWRCRFPLPSQDPSWHLDKAAAAVIATQPPPKGSVVPDDPNTQHIVLQVFRGPAPPGPLPVAARKKKEELEWLKLFRLESGKIEHLRVLLCGPAGSGKSSFINSVDSICQNRITGPADANNSEGTGKSYTLEYTTHQIKKERPGQHYPFVFNDIMGLEGTEGILLDDIKLAMKGHVKEKYKFNPRAALDHSNAFYNHNPTSNDKAHILVFVVAVNINDVADQKMFKKMAEVRLAARDLGIPQIAILTKIDEKSCPLVKKDLKNVYSSPYIKKAVEMLSNNVGFPINCIFPLKNYHAEMHLKDEVDMLILSAMRKLLDLANDRVNATCVAATN